MSASNSQRVGEIFKTAGTAFNTLGHLTSQLESSGQNASKWTDQVSGSQKHIYLSVNKSQFLTSFLVFNEIVYFI